MILSCPACPTRYLVDPALLGPDGREVRCAKCGHQWVQAPSEDPPPSLPPLEPEISAIPEGLGADAPASAPGPGTNLPAFPRPAPRRGSIWAWLLLLALVGIFAGGLFARDEIVAAWPQAARLYERLGLSSQGYNEVFAVRNGVSAYQQEDGQPVLVIQGEVVNISSAAQQVPTLRATLREQGRDVESWTFQATQSRLLPGEAASFVTRIKNPAPAATELTITFTDEK